MKKHTSHAQQCLVHYKRLWRIINDQCSYSRGLKISMLDYCSPLAHGHRCVCFNAIDMQQKHGVGNRVLWNEVACLAAIPCKGSMLLASFLLGSHSGSPSTSLSFKYVVIHKQGLSRYLKQLAVNPFVRANPIGIWITFFPSPPFCSHCVDSGFSNFISF